PKIAVLKGMRFLLVGARWEPVVIGAALGAGGGAGGAGEADPPAPAGAPPAQQGLGPHHGGRAHGSRAHAIPTTALLEWGAPGCRQPMSACTRGQSSSRRAITSARP